MARQSWPKMGSLGSGSTGAKCDKVLGTGRTRKGASRVVISIAIRRRACGLEQLRVLGGAAVVRRGMGPGAAVLLCLEGFTGTHTSNGFSFVSFLQSKLGRASCIDVAHASSITAAATSWQFT